MANTKISALTSATTPLAGTETLPIVQSGATTKVTVANLTAGRNVSMLGVTLTATTTATVYTDSVDGTDNKRLILSGAGAAGTTRSGYAITYGNEYSGSEGNIDLVAGVPGIAGSGVIRFLTAGAEAFRVDENKNLVQGTAAKGINFTANTPAAGMTSQLLNWYEEGTWTPAVAGSGTAGTYELSANTSCTYQRTGNLVTIVARVYLAAAVTGGGTGNVRVSGLPFSMSSTRHGSPFTCSISGIAFTGVFVSGERVTSAATSTLYFYGTSALGTQTQIPIASFIANSVLSFQFYYWV